MSNISPIRYPRLHRVLAGARWNSQDDPYTAPLEALDELERWLTFVDQKGQLDGHFLQPLRATPRQSVKAMSEVGAAYFLERHCSLPVVAWEPQGTNGKTGEFLVGLPDGRNLFVEVKAPGWEKEVREEEKRAAERERRQPRLRRQKHIGIEARPTAPWRSLRETVKRAYPQVRADMPTLLVILDDFFLALNCWPVDVVKAGLYEKGGSFVDRTFERLGAVGALNVETLGGIVYRFSLYDNPHCLTTVAVPNAVFLGYPRGNRTVPATEAGLSVESLRALCPGLSCPAPGSLSDGLDGRFIYDLLQMFDNPSVEQIAAFEKSWRERNKR